MAAEIWHFHPIGGFVKIQFVQLPVKDIWGVIMPSKDELARRQNISKSYLIWLSLICSQRYLFKTSFRDEFQGWFSSDFKKLNITTAHNLVYNAALMGRTKYRIYPDPE